MGGIWSCIKNPRSANPSPVRFNVPEIIENLPTQRQVSNSDEQEEYGSDQNYVIPTPPPSPQVIWGFLYKGRSVPMSTYELDSANKRESQSTIENHSTGCSDKGSFLYQAPLPPGRSGGGIRYGGHLFKDSEKIAAINNSLST